jgi:periplasmic divalent cation tolerance protein
MQLPRTDKVLVMVTCGSAKEARHIARALVNKRLAACVSILAAPVRSIYRWKEKVQSATEYLLLIKTARRLLPRTHAAVAGLHSYEVPEFIALPISAGSPAYLRWLDDCLATRASEPDRGRR